MTLEQTDSRPIKELLTIIKDHANKWSLEGKMKAGGLCHISTLTMQMGDITMNEHNFFLDYLYNNKPINKNTTTGMNAYFWKCQSLKPRINWLDKHIQDESNEI